MRTLLAAAALGVITDAYLTWAALSNPRYHETAIATAPLVHALGPLAGITLSVTGRLAALALLTIAADRLTAHRALPIYAIALTAAAITWATVLQNIDVLAR